MSIRASGRSALIIAVGLWLGFAGPMRVTDSAAEPAALTTHTENAGAPVKLGKISKHRSHNRHARKSAKPESKTDTKANETAHDNKTASETQDNDKKMPLPPTVANANAKAEMPGTAEDLPNTEASALTSSAGQMLSGNQGDSALRADTASSTATADIVSPDELNEIDRALTDDRPAAQHLALASIDIAPSASNADTTGQVATNDSAAWNHTSLIGKIFIAFGGLLTLGSAARMFMA
ncbi:hypothetical protein [Nitrobacter sp. JJSN]|uniref:hypothetical protein n=1 Tax=Nitrobacter sp. JJSN TaxID=3453033 RepID=UPI003F771C5A